MAQAPEQDCINAIPVCQSYYTQNNSYTGTGNNPEELDETNQGCLGAGEKNDVWYVINVTSSGTLAFTITPNDLSNDYDFGVWDITSTGCSAIFNYQAGTTNPYPPIGCNFSGTPGQTGLSSTITGDQWGPVLNVTAGQTLVLNVSNYSSSQSGYSLDFGASTASIFDTVKPTFSVVTTQCQFPSNTLKLTISEPIQCASIAPNGTDFYLTPASGVTVSSANGLSCNNLANSATNSIQLNLSGTLAPGTYWLHSQNGTDGNTLLDNCGNAMRVGDSVQFVLVNAVPPVMTYVDTPACIKASIHFDRYIKCGSVAPDGSDFVITGPGPVNISAASSVACANNVSDTVDVYFATPIAVPGTYTISLKNGTDGNAITDTCGLTVNNTVKFTVTDRGYITTTATPAVLCSPGYAQLTTIVSTVGPPLPLNCGVNGTACSGTPQSGMVGNTSATGTTDNSPFYGEYEGARTRFLIHKSELIAAGLTSGTISSVAMKVTLKGSSIPYSNFTIKMGCTSDTALTEFTPALPIVYTPKDYSTVQGVNTFQLDNTYDWDGNSNLEVEMCYTNTDFSDFDAVQTTTGVFPGATIHNHQDNTDGCALNAAYVSADRPNITFTECLPPAGPVKYVWTPSLYISDSSNANPTIYAPANTTYYVQIQDKNSCYRRNSVTISISVRNPQLLTHDTAVCIGSSVPLHVTGGNSYQWFPAAGLSDPTSADPIAAPTQTNTYHVSVVGEYGCADTLSVTVTILPLPPEHIINTDTTVKYGSTINLIATGANIYIWSPVGTLSDPNIPNPVAAPTDPTLYIVNGIDSNGCANSDSIQVNIDYRDNLMVPSAFTPNGDGRNDVFRITNITFQKILEFRVFNRWGQEIFSTTDPKGGWDGTWKGTPQDMGTFSYLIRVAYPDGYVETYKGDVTLIR